MIPRKIHYCWYGGKALYKLERRCMVSWKQCCPDYELVRWDERNLPSDLCEYAIQAIDAKKWAFVSDYVRVWALYHFGGIYLDTDVELLLPLDPFLNSPFTLGFESGNKIATSLIIATRQHPFLEALIEMYRELSFLQSDGSCNMTTNVDRVTKLLANRGLIRNGREQVVDGISIYPQRYFSPIHLEERRTEQTGNTYAIHHYRASWMTPRQRLHTQVARWIGPELSQRVKRLLGRTKTDQ